MASYNEQLYGDIDSSSDVLNLLGELCMNADHSDVTFIAENTKIPAHKTILSARSKYFQALFRGGFAEATQSEIELNVPLDAFKMILRFIYTGCMTLIPLNIKQIVDIYGLVELYDFELLKETISKYLAAKLSVDNCFEILDAAYLHSLDDLQNTCLTFMDHRSTEVLHHDSFKSMSVNSLATLLMRDTFYAPEIDIFHAVKDWSINNPAIDSKPPLSLIRWSLISMDELMDTIVASNVLDRVQLMDIVMKNRDNKAHRNPCSPVELSGENFALKKYGAYVISGENSEVLLNGNFTIYFSHNGSTYHAIPEGYQHSSIVVHLGKIRIINYIEMLLMDKDERSYSYYIDVSVDGVEYKRLIDCTAYYYRSWQKLHFPSRPVLFIKLVGTRAINIPQGCYSRMLRINNNELDDCDQTFNVVGLKAMYIEGHDTANDFIRPTNNVANPKCGAIVIEGAGGNNMLNDNMDEFTCHEIGEHRILLQLNQPYYINSVRMLLGCGKIHSNQYSFYIETSLDNENWQMAVDKRDENLSGWQEFEFVERPVIFVKIVGTKTDINFVCTYFECPRNPRKPNLGQSQSTLPS